MIKTMKSFALLLTITFMFVSMQGQSISTDRYVGKWKLNLVKSRFERTPPVAGSTLVISEASALHFRWRVTSISSDGRGSEMGFDGAIDGKPYPYIGAVKGTQMTFVENNGILDGKALYPNGGTMHQTMAVSPDGNILTADCSLNFPSASTSWTEVWERIPDKKHKAP